MPKLLKQSRPGEFAHLDFTTCTVSGLEPALDLHIKSLGGNVVLEFVPIASFSVKKKKTATL